MDFRKLATAFAVGVCASTMMMPQAKAETLKIGLIAPMTGGGAPWGTAMQQAATIAASEANAGGGLDVAGKKYRVEIVTYDDQYKAAEAVGAYNRLVNQDDVKYVVLLTSASTLAVKKNIEADKILALTAAFTSKAIDADTKYLKRLSSIPLNYAKPLIAWLAENRKERRVILANPNDETGWETSKVDEEAFKASGFQVLGNELFDRAQKDFQPFLTKIIGQNPEVIDLGSTPPPTTGLIIRQARDLGYKGLFIKTGGPGPKEMLEAAGSREAVEGMIAMDYADPTTAGFQRIAAEYKKAVGQDPNHMIAPYYDAITLLLFAIKNAGTVEDTAKVSATFERVLPMDSVQGGTLYYRDQQILCPIFVTQMKNGRADVIGMVEVKQ